MAVFVFQIECVGKSPLKSRGRVSSGNLNKIILKLSNSLAKSRVLPPFYIVERNKKLDEEQDQQYHASGVISDLISAFVAKNDSQEDELKDGKLELENEKTPSEEEEEEEEGGGGGGLVDGLISHLLTPEIAVAAPPDDEASILIHSVVHE
ncbi:uncharacterized protein [Henckelia pumila]|uniref:uncharacterized protein n=1 Tax=Henckelia pumila TaxID=405737 RepID=UPI003C6DBF33